MTTSLQPVADAPLYELRDVTRTYGAGDTRVTAVDHVDLRVLRGEFVVVAGPSGSGKTTLLQLLGALDRPTSGEIRFEGRDIDRMGDGELADLRRETLGLIFHDQSIARRVRLVQLRDGRVVSPEEAAEVAAESTIM